VRLFVLIMAAAILFSIFGCAGEGQDQAQLPATANQSAEVLQGQGDGGESRPCHSPYDGTYSGTVSASGQVEHEMADSPDTRMTPYIITYSLEVTFECVREPMPEFEGEDNWLLNVRRVKVSDPFFGCTNGCEPSSEGSDDISEAVMPQPGRRGGMIGINFPNGRYFQIVPLFADPDANRISADQLNHSALVEESIAGYTSRGGSEFERIETRGCQDCLYGVQQEGVTMVLDRIG